MSAQHVAVVTPFQVRSGFGPNVPTCGLDVATAAPCLPYRSMRSNLRG